MTGPRIAIFRADASPQIGSGHVRRCLALAVALRSEGWRCAFAVRPQTQETVPELVSEGWPVVALSGAPSEEPGLLAAHWTGGVDLLVADHYGRDVSFESACRGWAKRIVAIDDLADRRHDADLLLDQTLGREAGAYANLVPGDCRLLLGTAYALLRPRFSELRLSGARPRANGGLSRVVVSLGAVDPGNLTSTVIAGLSASGLRFDVDVMIGSAAPHLAAIREHCRTGGPMFTLHVDCPDPATLLANADLAIGAAGTSAWERCCLGVPTLLVVLAENQRMVAQALADRGAVELLAAGGALQPEAVATAVHALAGNSSRRNDMAAAAASICDGLGARRVAMELDPATTEDRTRVTLRPARRDDGELMYLWQSDPATRRFFHNPTPPAQAEHFAWLDRALHDRGCLLNIVEHQGSPAGVLRLDRAGEAFKISILIAPQYYRRGIAAAALALARRLMPDATLHAEVLEGNLASRGLFESAHYRRETDGLYVSSPAGFAHCVPGAA